MTEKNDKLNITIGSSSNLLAIPAGPSLTIGPPNLSLTTPIGGGLVIAPSGAGLTMINHGTGLTFADKVGTYADDSGSYKPTPDVVAPCGCKNWNDFSNNKDPRFESGECKYEEVLRILRAIVSSPELERQWQSGPLRAAIDEGRRMVKL